jgi:ferredoxin
MKAVVDKELCSSCGLCVETCPEVFEMDASDIAIVKVTPVPAPAESCCKEAADNCPGEAIKVL